jgi:fluoroquinolone transport system permease protein
MRNVTTLLRLELTLQLRSFLYPATVVSTALICAFALVLGPPLNPRFTAFLVFLDPATIGLSFVGAMVLMEKTQGTLSALGVTPLQPASYVAAKTVSLTLVTFASGLTVTWVATGGAFGWPRQLLALGLSSAVAVLIGLACVARAASMNQLVVTLLWVSTVLYLPLLSHFGVVPRAAAPIFAVIPSYAMLVALASAVDANAVSASIQLAAVLYLTVWVLWGWRRTVREFEGAILTQGR